MPVLSIQFSADNDNTPNAKARQHRLKRMTEREAAQGLDFRS